MLGAEEDLGRALIRGLSDPARERAIIARDAFDDIITGPGREGSLSRPAGLPLGTMEESHRTLAMRIIEEFIGTMRPDVAEAERARIRDAGLEQSISPGPAAPSRAGRIITGCTAPTS